MVGLEAVQEGILIFKHQYYKDLLPTDINLKKYVKICNDKFFFL